MKYHKGQKLYGCFADDITGRVELSTYQVRTIRGGFVYAIHWIKGITWGRLSRKSVHYGWLDPIDPLFRCRAAIGDRFDTLHTTKRMAYMASKKHVTANKRGWYGPSVQKRILTTLKRQLTRIKT